MTKYSFLGAALSMMAALMMTACSNDDNTIESAAQQNVAKTIPYTVTVNGGTATRATVQSDNKTLYFADGDKLYVTGTKIKGVLNIQAGNGSTTGPGTASATFSGDLTYSGEGSPAADLELTATLVSVQQRDGSEVTINATTGAVTVNYPTTAYCADVASAVQKFSNLTGTSRYDTKSFTLSQQTAFLSFAVKLKSSVAAGDAVTATVKNGSTTLSTASVTTTTDASSNVVADFVLPVAKGTVLSGATVTIGTLATLGVGGDVATTLDGKVYNVTRSIVDLASCSDSYAAQDGDYITYSDIYYFDGYVTIANGATVTLGGAKIESYSSDYAAIHCLGDANIVLAGGTTNTVEAYRYAGIFVPESKTLTISGTGRLEATGTGGAGIGGAYDVLSPQFTSCGNIRITGGNITATGYDYCAGIGGGHNGSCGNISIEGGTIVATPTSFNGNGGAAGIGSGCEGSCGNISITGGSVTATGSDYHNSEGAAGIGSGYRGSCGTITIGSDVTKIIATMSLGAVAPIGKGYSASSCGTITIDGLTTWTAGTATTHYSWDVSNENKTWTLTKQ